MNVVDSSGWLEIFSGGTNAETFAEVVADSEHLVVPVISIYEVFKVLLRESDETTALAAVTSMRQGRVVDLAETTALFAARLSLNLSLPMADALILATAREHRATLWTQDKDFEGMDEVRYLPRD